MSDKNTEQERAVYEKAIKNPNIPENVKEIARKKLADLDAKTPKKEVKEKVVKQPQPKKEKVVKQAEPKKEKAVESNDYDCDELISKEKETRKKRKIAAEKRAGQPKKKPATKIKEGIETISDKIEGGVEKGNVSKAELEKLIASAKALLSRLEKQLEGFSAKKMAEGGNIDENINEKVLRSLSPEKQDQVLSDIAKHYHKTKAAILVELNDSEAEKIYDYIKNKNLRKAVYKAYQEYIYNNKFANGGSIPRTKKAIASDKNLRALPKGERVSRPYAIIKKANGKVFKRRNVNQFGKVKGGKFYSEYRPEHTDKDQKKRF